MEHVVRRVWSEETGEQLGELPEGLGQLADDNDSIGLALQQIASSIGTGDQLPESFAALHSLLTRLPLHVALPLCASMRHNAGNPVNGYYLKMRIDVDKIKSCVIDPGNPTTT